MDSRQSQNIDQQDYEKTAKSLIASSLAAAADRVKSLSRSTQGDDAYLPCPVHDAEDTRASDRLCHCSRLQVLREKAISQVEIYKREKSRVKSIRESIDQERRESLKSTQTTPAARLSPPVQPVSVEFIECTESCVSHKKPHLCTVRTQQPQQWEGASARISDVSTQTLTESSHADDENSSGRSSSRKSSKKSAASDYYDDEREASLKSRTATEASARSQSSKMAESESDSNGRQSRPKTIESRNRTLSDEESSLALESARLTPQKSRISEQQLPTTPRSTLAKEHGLSLAKEDSVAEDDDEEESELEAQESREAAYMMESGLMASIRSRAASSFTDESQKSNKSEKFSSHASANNSLRSRAKTEASESLSGATLKSKATSLATALKSRMMEEAHSDAEFSQDDHSQLSEKSRSKTASTVTNRTSMESRPHTNYGYFEPKVTSVDDLEWNEYHKKSISKVSTIHSSEPQSQTSKSSQTSAVKSEVKSRKSIHTEDFESRRASQKSDAGSATTKRVADNSDDESEQSCLSTRAESGSKRTSKSERICVCAAKYPELFKHLEEL